VPTPEAPQPEKKPANTDQPKLDLLVGGDRGDVFSGIPAYFYDSVVQSCAARLDDSQGVRVDVTTREMNRGEAVSRAKNEKEAYVIWLHLRGDNHSGTNPDDIYIEYTVFEPTSAKVKTQGSTYQGTYRKRGGVLAPPRTAGGTNTAITESRLRDAAEDAAERILKALHVALPSDIPIH